MDSPKVAGSAATSVWERRKRRVRVYKNRITLKWFLAIVVVAVSVSCLFVSLRGCIFSFYDMEDASYRPHDIEGRYHELQKMKEAVERERQAAR
jgi:hypothetical protein